MSLIFDAAAAFNVAKELYNPDDVEVLTFKSSFLALCPKATDGEGQHYVGIINTALQSSVSTNDTVAFTSGNASQYARFTLPWFSHYAGCFVSGTALDMCKSSQGAMIDLITQEMDNGYSALGEEMGQEAWGYGGAALGVVNGVAATTTNVAGDTIVINATAQAINFSPGMLVQSSLSTTGTSGVIRPGSVTLLNADMITGSLVANQAWTAGITGFTTSDGLYRSGEFGAFAPGVPAWIPSSANRPTPGAASAVFNGFDRSTAPTQTAGVYLAGNGADMQETLTTTAIYISKFGGKPGHAFFSPTDYANLVRGLQGRVVYTTETAFENAQIGFDGIKIATAAGPITCLMDPYVPQGSAWLMTMNDIVFKTLGEAPKNLTEEHTGLIWIPQTGSNNFIAQLGYRGTYFVKAPNHCGAATF